MTLIFLVLLFIQHGWGSRPIWTYLLTWGVSSGVPQGSVLGLSCSHWQLGKHSSVHSRHQIPARLNCPVIRDDLIWPLLHQVVPATSIRCLMKWTDQTLHHVFTFSACSLTSVLCAFPWLPVATRIRSNPDNALHRWETGKPSFTFINYYTLIAHTHSLRVLHDGTGPNNPEGAYRTCPKALLSPGSLEMWSRPFNSSASTWNLQ